MSLNRMTLGKMTPSRCLFTVLLS